MEKLTTNFLPVIETTVKLIDTIAESAFLELLKECDNLSELETRTFHFDKYPDLPVETVTICEMVASRVRKMASAYIDNEKSQHKIVLGDEIKEASVLPLTSRNVQAIGSAIHDTLSTAQEK
ncbi:hypothetical protein ABZ559_11245 [Streptococcus sp. ZY19097]|uniref:hypothetical protein n=1 Tax=Streptococcus sp. ZY19097 TaxID=3231906 RepID=UPI0034587086